MFFKKNGLLDNVAVKIAGPLFGLLACGSLATLAAAHAVRANCVGFQKVIRPQVVIATCITTGLHLPATVYFSHQLVGLMENFGHPASLRDGDSSDKGDKNHDHADGNKGDKDHHDGDDDGDDN